MSVRLIFGAQTSMEKSSGVCGKREGGRVHLVGYQLPLLNIPGLKVQNPPVFVKALTRLGPKSIIRILIQQTSPKPQSRIPHGEENSMLLKKFDL